MLKNLLNLLPASIVRQLGDGSFANLQERGEITKYRTREEALAAAKREIDLLIKEKAKNGRK